MENTPVRSRLAAAPWVRLKEKIDEFGPAYAAYLALRRLTREGVFEFRKAIIVALELDPARPGPHDDPEFREVSHNEAELLTALKQDETESRDRLEQGQRAWIIERDGQPIALQWTGGTAREVSNWLILEGSPGDLWGGGIVVDPRCRGQGHGPRLLALTANRISKAGHLRLLGAIDTPNQNSLRAFLKSGYQPIGTLFFLRLLSLTLVRSGPHWRLGYWNSNKRLRLPVAAMSLPDLTPLGSP